VKWYVVNGRRRKLWLLVLLLPPLGFGALAADQAPRPEPDPSATYQADSTAVDAASRAMVTGGAAALAQHVGAMEQALTHMPAGYREIEQAADGIRYRSANLADFLEFRVWYGARPGAAKTNVVWLPRIYLTAGFMLGWYYNEMNQPDKAIIVLDRVLARSPEDGRVANEKANALVRLRRLDDALTVYDGALGSGLFMPSRVRALLLRGRGFCLTELKRYDAAEQAYRDSLVLEPSHLGARNELAYIAKVRGGGAPTAPSVTTYDKAKQGSYQDGPIGSAPGTNR
jgi:tetratricopeptide (TPR) repeat protein